MADDAKVFARPAAPGLGVAGAVPVPALQDYDVSPLTGFLPEEPPLTKLEDPHFQPWEALVENLNSLMLAGQLRGAVHKLPLLDHARLRNVRELRRAFLVLCMIGHAYVWGKAEPPSEIIPAQLAVPWHHVAEKLQLRPVVCQAAVVLWNWRLLDPKKGWDLSNFAALHTYSGSTDEAWFYLVTTAIEAEGAKALPACIAAQNAARSGNIDAAISALEIIERVAANLNVILKRMYDHCDPYVFYWRIRPYLAGWDNMADAGLPHGVRYEGVPNSGASPGELPAYRKYAGGSAAQSSLIQALDVSLGIEHRPTGQQKVPEERAAGSQHDCSAASSSHAGDTANGHAAAHRQNGVAPGTCNGVGSANNDVSAANGKPEAKHDQSPHHNFIVRMRDYMPGPHRRFLDHLAKAATLRTFVKDVVSPRAADASLSEKERETARRLVHVYDSCLHQVKLFRDKHIQIVTLYVVIQARRGPSVGSAHVAHQGSPAYEHIAKTVTTVIHSPNGLPSAGDSNTVMTMTTLESTFVPVGLGINSAGGGFAAESPASAVAVSEEASQPEANQGGFLRRLSLRSARSFPSLPKLSCLYPGLPDANAPDAARGEELPQPSTPQSQHYAASLSPSFPQADPAPAATTNTIQSVEVTEMDQSGHVKRHTIGLARQADPSTGVVRGTGGTDLLPFLKQARDEVTECRIGNDLSSSKSKGPILFL